MLIVGIDLGLQGGVAGISTRDGVVVCVPMPIKVSSRGKNVVDAFALWDLLTDWRDVELIDLAIIERVSAMPKQGVTSMFNFGRSVGKVQAVLEVLGIPTEEPTPQKWKSVVLAGTDKSKAAAVGYVRQRFPGCNLVPKGCRKPHEGMADAICLAEYGRRLMQPTSVGYVTHGKE